MLCRSLRLTAVAGTLLLPLAAQIQISTSESASNSPLTVSSTDLLQTNLSSIASSGSFLPAFSPNTLTLLTNGQFGAGGNSFADTVGPQNGATITFSLDLTAPGASGGYSISSISTYTGWDSGRDGQEYTVAFSTASAPSIFTTITSTGQLNPTTGGDNFAVTIINTGGYLATNVAAIKFTFTSFENNGSGYREIDIIGIPEPATTSALGGAGVLVLSVVITRRRRRQAIPAT